MKKNFFISILMTAILFASAQTQKVAQKESFTKAASASEQAAKQTEGLTQALSLNAQQKEKVSAICAEYFAVREQSASLNKEEFSAKMKATQEQGEAKLKTFLSKEQWVKFEDYKKQQQAGKN